MYLKFVPDNRSVANDNLDLSVDETSAETGQMNTKRPYGRWILSAVDYPPSPDPAEVVNVTDVDVSWLEDVLLVIEYEAKVHYNR